MLVKLLVRIAAKRIIRAELALILNMWRELINNCSTVVYGSIPDRGHLAFSDLVRYVKDRLQEKKIEDPYKSREDEKNPEFYNQ